MTLPAQPTRGRSITSIDLISETDPCIAYRFESWSPRYRLELTEEEEGTVRPNSVQYTVQCALELALSSVLPLWDDAVAALH